MVCIPIEYGFHNWPAPWRVPCHGMEDGMTVRFGLLGAGRIGKVHAKAISGDANAKLVAVADAMADGVGDTGAPHVPPKSVLRAILISVPRSFAFHATTTSGREAPAG